MAYSLWVEPLDSDPPGADLSLNQLPKNCPLISGDHIAYKLNPAVNFSTKNSVFDLITPLGTKIDECATRKEIPTVLIVSSSGCEGLSVNVPAGETGIPFQHWAHFSCADSGVNVNVEFDECTGDVVNVACDQEGAICGASVPAVQTSNTYIYATVPTHPDPALRERSFPISNMGPGTPGVIVCTGTDSEPVYLRGDKAWWCGGPPPLGQTGQVRASDSGMLEVSGSRRLLPK